MIKTRFFETEIEHAGATYKLRELTSEQQAKLFEVAETHGAMVAGMRRFLASLVGWENVQASEGPLEFNDENKQLVYDLNIDLVQVLITEFDKRQKKFDAAEKKILKRGPSGTLTPKK